MKKSIVVILVGYVIVVILGLLSCEEERDCGPFPDKFKLKALSWKIYKAVYSEESEEKLLLSEIENDTVDYNKFSIFITPIKDTYFSMVEKRFSFNLINCAYACSPIDPVTEERIDSIKITCNENFNENYPIGKDISGLFDVIVLDKISSLYYSKLLLSEYVNERPLVPDEITLMLNSPPDSTTDFEFTIQYYQDGIDLDYFEFKTDKVVIKM